MLQYEKKFLKLVYLGIQHNIDCRAQLDQESIYA